MAEEFDFNLPTQEDMQAQSLADELRTTLTDLRKSGMEGKVPRNPEQTLDSVLLTTSDLENEDPATLTDEDVSRLFRSNDEIVRADKAGLKKEAVVHNKNLDIDAGLQSDIRAAFNTALQAPDDETRNAAMEVVIKSTAKYNLFINNKKGSAVSLLDVMSDLSEPEVQRYGSQRAVWNAGFRDLMQLSAGTFIPLTEDNMRMFFQAANQTETAIGEKARFDPQETQPLNPLAVGFGKQTIGVAGSAAAPALSRLADSRAVKAMADHPYVTSAIIDTTIVALTAGGRPGVALGASALRFAVIKAGLKKGAGKWTIKTLAEASKISRKELAKGLMAARISGSTQIGLGLGAVYVAGEMLEDGSSKTVAALTEILGPAAVSVLLNFGKSAGIAYLRLAAKNNSALFKKLNAAADKFDNLLATELKANMRVAVETQDQVIGKLRKDIIDQEIVGAEKPPLAKLMANADQIDDKALDSIGDMVDIALKGKGDKAEAIRSIVAMDGLEVFAGSPRLQTAGRIVLNAETDIDGLVKMIDASPEIGSAFRGAGGAADDQIAHITAELTTEIPANLRGTLNTELGQLTKASKLFKEASAKFDLKSFDANSQAFMQTDQARAWFSTLPQFQGINGKILYGEMAAKFVSKPVKILDRTFHFINTTVRSAENRALKLHTFGVTPGTWADSGKGWSKRLFEKAILSPSSHLRTQFDELVNVASRGTEQQRVLAAQYNNAWTDIQNTLSRKQRRLLEGVLKDGDDSGQVFKVVKGGLVDNNGKIHQYTPELTEAYEASRALLDSAYRMGNIGVLKTMRAKGLRLLDGKVIVQPKPAVVGQNGVTQAMVDEGYVKVGIFDDQLKVYQDVVLSPDQVRKRVTDMPDNFDALGYTDGYIPRKAEGKWRVASINMRSDGKYFVKTEAIAMNQQQAQGAVTEMLKVNEDPGTVFMAVKNGLTPAILKKQVKGGRIKVQSSFEAPAKETVTEFIKTLDTDSALQKLSGEQLDDLADALSAAGLGREVADDLVAEARYFSGPSYTKARAKVRPKDAADLTKDAPQMDVNDSVQQYFDQMSKHVNLGETLALQQNKFLRTYGRFLANENDWTSKVQISKALNETGFDDGAKALEAWSVQNQIKIIAGMKTAEQAAIDSGVALVRDNMIKKGNFRIAKAMDSIADSAQIQGTVRGLTAKGIFGLYNFSHFVIQAATGMVATTGRAVAHNPADIQKAMKSTLGYIYGRTAKRMGLPLTQEQKFFVRFVDESGYLANANYVAIDNGVLHNTTGVASLLDKSVAFTRQGEATQRLYAMAWNFHHNVRLIKAGKHPLGFTLDDVGGLKFRDHIKNQSDLTALNMGKLNQPPFAQGTLGATGFQFQQIQSQIAQMYFGIGGAASQITRLERLGIWAVGIAAFGPKSVPFSETAMTLTDHFIANDFRIGDVVLKEGQPQDAGKLQIQMQNQLANFVADNMRKLGFEGDEQWWRRAAEGGWITAGSEGMFQITDRATLQLMTNTYYDNLQPSDAFGPGLNLLFTMIGGGIETSADLARIMSSDKEKLESSDIIKAARKTIGVLGGARNIISTVEALMDGKVTTRSGQAIIDGLSLKQIMDAAPHQRTEKIKDVLGVAVGLPGERQRLAQKENIVSLRQREAWDEWQTIQIMAIRRATLEGNFDAAYAMADAASKQVEDYRTYILPFFLKNIMHALAADPNATIEQRNRFNRIKFNLNGDSKVPLF